MACGDTGDVNVFLTLSRVGFNDHHSTQAPTSLLTFADLVLALDNKGSSSDAMTNVTNAEKQLQDDHTYASNKTHKMTTRSQALKINKNSETLLQSVYDKQGHCDMSDVRNETKCKCLSTSDPGEVCKHIDKCQSSESLKDQCQCHSCLGECSSPLMSSCRHQDMDVDRKVKRSSSVENITTESISIDSYCEWPQTSRKNSPRKSCSFEEVNRNSGSHKSEDKHKGGSSGQLHRLVNDTLEFPCWPRKADHTYATATWDGTAASHSLFEQELNQEDTKVDEMEVAETYVSPNKKTSSKLNFSADDQNRSVAVFQNYSYQKEDHTYVKQSAKLSSSTFSNFESDSFRRSSYSSSTFPRQKSREDHTYFSSGLSKYSSCSSGVKDLNGIPVVINLSQRKDKGDVGVKILTSQFCSAKKDHNYFTSA